jgi:hypothetical protein
MKLHAHVLEDSVETDSARASLRARFTQNTAHESFVKAFGDAEITLEILLDHLHTPTGSVPLHPRGPIGGTDCLACRTLEAMMKIFHYVFWKHHTS